VKGNNMSDENDTGSSRIIAFRCPAELAEAMEAAAAEALSSVSDVARQSILREMREKGYLATIVRAGK
jgi:hypothetical protein